VVVHEGSDGDVGTVLDSSASDLRVGAITEGISLVGGAWHHEQKVGVVHGGACGCP
jgi:hypothetical protein